jgi:hypothetical protein
VRGMVERDILFEGARGAIERDTLPEGVRA